MFGMDKVGDESCLFLQAGLPDVVNYVWFFCGRSGKSDIARKIVKKRSSAHWACLVLSSLRILVSSVGVSRADDKKSLEQAVELAAPI